MPVYFMQSDGGLTSVADFSGHKAILSGPAGILSMRGGALWSLLVVCGGGVQGGMTALVSEVFAQARDKPPMHLMPNLASHAGGYVGYAMTTRWGGVDGDSLQMIGFDMGGTSTGE